MYVYSQEKKLKGTYLLQKTTYVEIKHMLEMTHKEEIKEKVENSLNRIMKTKFAEFS